MEIIIFFDLEKELQLKLLYISKVDQKVLTPYIGEHLKEMDRIGYNKSIDNLIKFIDILYFNTINPFNHKEHLIRVDDIRKFENTIAIKEYFPEKEIEKPLVTSFNNFGEGKNYLKSKDLKKTNGSFIILNKNGTTFQFFDSKEAISHKKSDNDDFFGYYLYDDVYLDEIHDKYQCYLNDNVFHVDLSYEYSDKNKNLIEIKSNAIVDTGCSLTNLVTLKDYVKYGEATFIDANSVRIKKDLFEVKIKISILTEEEIIACLSVINLLGLEYLKRKKISFIKYKMDIND